MIFKYKEDRLPVLLICLLFALDISIFLLAEAAWIAPAWMLIGIFPKTCVCAFGHHHQHINTFKPWPLNRLLEVILGFQTGITSQAWFLHHVVGHHKHYLDQTMDESRWQRPDGTKMQVVEYSMSVALTGYPRAYGAGDKLPRYRAIFVVMLLLQVVLLGILFWLNWWNALFVFALPMAISLYITAWHTYYHHAGLETDSPYEASYNIIHTWYNRFTCNLGYHTAHHKRGSLHWSKLPELHEKMVDKIPPHLYRKPCIPFKWMGKCDVLPPEQSTNT